MADNENGALKTLYDSVEAWRDSRQGQILEQAEFLKGLGTSVGSVSESVVSAVTDDAMEILEGLSSQVTTG